MTKQMAPPSDGGLSPPLPLQYSKAWQRQIRERHALEFDLLLEEKRALASVSEKRMGA